MIKCNTLDKKVYEILINLDKCLKFVFYNPLLFKHNNDSEKSRVPPSVPYRKAFKPLEVKIASWPSILKLKKKIHLID